MEKPVRMDDLGVPAFQETSIDIYIYIYYIYIYIFMELEPHSITIYNHQCIAGNGLYKWFVVMGLFLHQRGDSLT